MTETEDLPLRTIIVQYSSIDHFIMTTDDGDYIVLCPQLAFMAEPGHRFKADAEVNGECKFFQWHFAISKISAGSALVRRYTENSLNLYLVIFSLIAIFFVG